jgi:UDP-N-acetyl-D-mannosaminuronic acid transferase (WecB/TagA/CpsF family)
MDFEARGRGRQFVAMAGDAAIKFHSGWMVTPPRWASMARLELLWRLLHEPRTVWRRAPVYGPSLWRIPLFELSRHITKSGG